MANYTVYIDEAGDLGINRGTKWFVLTAVVIEKSQEPLIRTRIATIKTRMNIKEIHFRKIPDFVRRAFIVRELNDLPFTYMNVIVDTTKFDSQKIPNPDIAYNYVCKYLLQRVSWYLRDKKETADIMLSARSTSKDNDLILYIQNKLLPYPDNNIESSVFNKITAKTAATWDMLQIADVCATSMFLSYEVNGWGFCVPCYSYVLANHLYRRENKVNAYGVKFFTNQMVPNKEELNMLKICAKKERTPGATTT